MSSPSQGDAGRKKQEDADAALVREASWESDLKTVAGLGVKSLCMRSSLDKGQTRQGYVVRGVGASGGTHTPSVISRVPRPEQKLHPEGKGP